MLPHENNFHGNKLLHKSVRLESISNCYELRATVSLTAGLPISELDPQMKGEEDKEEKRRELGWVFPFWE